MPQTATAAPSAAATSMMLSAPIELRSSPDGGLPAKFAGLAYSGGFVPGYESVIDLSSTSFRDRIPLLNRHDHGDIIGVVEQAAAKEGQMTVAGRLFSDMPGSGAERIAQLAQRGAPFEMSVGLYNFTREYVPAGKTASANGQTFNGPVNVLRHGQVREVSVVTLGADPRTSSSFFDQGAAMPDTAALTAQVAQLTAQIDGHAAALAAARAEGAAAERQRIASVQEQSMPGHERLIASLMLDGKTTGPEAAMAVLAAERAQRTAAAAALAADAPKPVPVTAAAAVQPAAQDDKHLPLDQRAKAQWEADTKLRAEFSSLSAYTAYQAAQERGAARILTRTV